MNQIAFCLFLAERPLTQSGVLSSGLNPTLPSSLAAKGPLGGPYLKGSKTMARGRVLNCPIHLVGSLCCPLNFLLVSISLFPPHPSFALAFGCLAPSSANLSHLRGLRTGKGVECLQCRRQSTFPVRGQTVNLFSFIGHFLSPLLSEWAQFRSITT